MINFSEIPISGRFGYADYFYVKVNDVDAYSEVSGDVGPWPQDVTVVYPVEGDRLLDNVEQPL